MINGIWYNMAGAPVAIGTDGGETGLALSRDFGEGAMVGHRLPDPIAGRGGNHGGERYGNRAAAAICGSCPGLRRS
ncbi:MAG: hypothetical protein GY789_17465 [Hyphomicrobiales bacterium]|nr:hypothetical protein [Hyphomicrobiales bacterium]